ncbi:MAG: hypothetical protein JRI35_04695 [Deltaproteobacteria bacterium]|nr:hypothetical protein [Deltaproteobacteria bacterium]MBW1967374.1 hypothetical protein [Deltaproteobacteria bacterium]MBW2098273.1 hypothetical protein [Deltaproteobacteria bacterium]
MKLRQNAKELVLIEVDGLGLILGEIRYNRQTETVLFALEKAAFFDLYFPCAVLYDQERGPVVRPHVLTAMTVSSIRIQRSRVSFFVLESDINPKLIQQYHDLLESVLLKRDVTSVGKTAKDQGPDRPEPTGGSRVIALSDRKGRQ